MNPETAFGVQTGVGDDSLAGPPTDADVRPDPEFDAGAPLAPEVFEFGRQYIGEFMLAGELVADLLTGYLVAFERLRLTPDDVADYLRAERAVLADLDWEARRPVPSADTLLRSALRLAVDARAPVDPRTHRIASAGPVPAVHRFSDSNPLPFTLQKPVEVIDTLTPPAAEVLQPFAAEPVDHPRLAATTERLFRRAVTRADTTEFVFGRLVEYGDTAGELRLWVCGVPVDGVGTAECQLLLRHFCRHPDDRLTVEQFVDQFEGSPGGRNPARAATKLKKALGRAGGPAREWFLTAPFRWADGVVVRPRPGAD